MCPFFKANAIRPIYLNPSINSSICILITSLECCISFCVKSMTYPGDPFRKVSTSTVILPYPENKKNTERYSDTVEDIKGQILRFEFIFAFLNRLGWKRYILDNIQLFYSQANFNKQ